MPKYAMKLAIFSLVEISQCDYSHHQINRVALITPNASATLTSSHGGTFIMQLFFTKVG